ncbi:hypothetical protein PFISCL1PPCAC_28473, partial [Pristionchus fissidentatus]
SAGPSSFHSGSSRLPISPVESPSSPVRNEASKLKDSLISSISQSYLSRFQSPADLKESAAATSQSPRIPDALFEAAAAEAKRDTLALY